MSFGIARGIEKVNKIMMPAFYVLFLFLAIRVAFLDGAAEGYAYLFKPDWSAMANPKTWVYAMGQAFFSLSVAGSGTVVYGSYLKSDVDIVSSAKYVAIFDTFAALLSGLVIIPAVFAYGMEPNSGPGLLSSPSRLSSEAFRSDRFLPSSSSWPSCSPVRRPLSTCWKVLPKRSSPGSAGPEKLPLPWSAR